MLEDLKKTIDKGIDFAFAKKDQLTKAAQDLAKENKLTKEEAKKLYDHLLKNRMRPGKHSRRSFRVLFRIR